MTALTPSRGEYADIHSQIKQNLDNPFIATAAATAKALLQPSPFDYPSTSNPPLDSTVAVHPTSHNLSSNADMSKLDTHSHHIRTKHASALDGASRDDVFDSWGRTLQHSNASASTSKTVNASREILASINTNLTTAIAPVYPTISKQNKFSTANSIPRPAAVPDVFTPDVVKRHDIGQTTRLGVNPSASGSNGKRARELSLPTPPTSISATKRLKLLGGNRREGGEPAGRTSAKEEEEKWIAKWVKVFPTLVFHFEIGAEDGAGKQLRNRILRMGAKIDQFFSTRVTHLIVKGVSSPQKPKAVPLSRRNDSTRESHKNPFLDGTGVTDLVQKAEAMNMKVWNVKKLAEILSRIVPPETTTRDSLSTLLEDEKLHGTRERDFSAPRPDYYYFKPGNKYLLVEDATSKHRTVMVKEYAYNQKEGPDWPTLYDGFLRVSSSMQTTVPIDKIRARAWALYVERENFEGEQPPHELKRSTSLRAFPTTPKLPEAQPYHDASGNSVVLTSTTASTSTAGTPIFGGFNGLGSLGANKDRAIMQMSKRVQVLKGNARLAAAKQHDSKVDSYMDHDSSSYPTNDGPSRRASTGYVQPAKTFLTQDQVVKMLQQAREPVQETVTAQMRMRNREKVDMGLKGREQDTAAGYCENCRLRYTDLSVHIASKKHRRFALNDENFEALDNLLYALQRPPHPATMTMRYPPCNERHGKDADCHLCDVEMGSDDEGAEEQGTSVCGSESQFASEDGDGDGSGREAEEDQYFVDEDQDREY